MEGGDLTGCLGAPPRRHGDSPGRLHGRSCAPAAAGGPAAHRTSPSSLRYTPPTAGPWTPVERLLESAAIGAESPCELDDPRSGTGSEHDSKAERIRTPARSRRSRRAGGTAFRSVPGPRWSSSGRVAALAWNLSLPGTHPSIAAVAEPRTASGDAALDGPPPSIERLGPVVTPPVCPDPPPSAADSHEIVPRLLFVLQNCKITTKLLPIQVIVLTKNRGYLWRCSYSQNEVKEK